MLVSYWITVELAKRKANKKKLVISFSSSRQMILGVVCVKVVGYLCYRIAVPR